MSGKRHVSNRIKIAVGGALLIAAAVPVTSGLMQQQTLIARNAAAAQAYTPKPVVMPTTEVLRVGSFQAAAKKLADAKAPFTLSIVGDSTSYPKQGWVEDVAQQISERSGRLVNVHTWNLETGKYDPVHSYGEGEPALTIWNGSAPGRDAMYSMAHLAEMMQAKPDMVIINHGHNVSAVETIRTLAFRVAERSGHAPMAVTKQNPRSNGSAAAHAEKMQEVEALAKDLPGVVLVDAYAAFPKAPATWLSADGVHPNPEGYQAWASVVMARLGFGS